MPANRSENQYGKTNATNNRVPFDEIDRNVCFQQCSNRRNTYSGMPLKFMRTNSHEMILNNSALPQKENSKSFGEYTYIYIRCMAAFQILVNFFGSIDDFYDVQANQSEPCLRSRKRPSLKRTHDQLPFSHFDDIEEIINNKISTQNLLSHYLAPPKPDTPVDNVSYSVHETWSRIFIFVLNICVPVSTILDGSNLAH